MVLIWKIRMFNEGVSAYIIKSPDIKIMVSIFNQVAAGNRIIPQEVSLFTPSLKTVEQKPTLTSHEKEIVTKLVQGYSITQIAISMYKTPSALDKILHGTKKKYQVRTLYELVALLAKVGMI